MSAGAHRWKCDRCGVAVGRIDGGETSLPETWESGVEGEFCLTCRRGRAADAAQAAVPDDSSIADRARAGRAGLIEFEVRRTPDLTNSSIARACRTSASSVAAARQRLGLAAGPPPTSAGGVTRGRGATANRR